MTRDESSTPPQGAVARGRVGEQIAAAWLRLRGLTVLDHNRRADGGEIDLIARDGDCLVFVEVRLRRVGAWVGPGGSIDPRKRARLRACARRLLRDHPELSWPGRAVRFDVVTLVADGARLVVEHLRSVRL